LSEIVSSALVSDKLLVFVNGASGLSHEFHCQSKYVEVVLHRKFQRLTTEACWSVARCQGVVYLGK